MLRPSTEEGSRESGEVGTGRVGGRRVTGVGSAGVSEVSVVFTRPQGRHTDPTRLPPKSDSAPTPTREVSDTLSLPQGGHVDL